MLDNCYVLCEECHSVFLHPLSSQHLTAFCPIFLVACLRSRLYLDQKISCWGVVSLRTWLRKWDVGLGKLRIETSSFSFVFRLYERWSKELPPKILLKTDTQCTRDRGTNYGYNSWLRKSIFKSKILWL